MSNDYLHLSAGEAMYFGQIREESWTDFQARKATEPAPEPTAEQPLRPAKRKAGRKPLDEAGRVASANKTALRKERLREQRADRKAERQAEAKRVRDLAQARKDKIAEIKKKQEEDRARANRPKDPAPLPAAPAYQVLRTREDGTRVVKVDRSTELEVRAGRNIDETVSRFMNRKQTLL